MRRPTGTPDRPQRRTPSSATHSPSRSARTTSSPAPANAARTSPSRSTKIPDARTPPAGNEFRGELVGEPHQHRRDQVREHDVERRFAASGALPWRARDRDGASPFRRAFAVGRVDGDRVGVEAENARCSEPRRRDREDPRPASDVEAARPREHALVGPALDAGEAEPGRRVQPRPERHARIQREHDVVRRPPVPPPGRPDDEPTADAEHGEMRFPGVRPVGLVDHARLEFADRAQVERLEMARARSSRRRPPARIACASRAGRYARTIGGPRRIEAGAEALVDQLERGLDARAARRVAASGSR